MNTRYTKARESFLKGEFNVAGTTIKLALVDATYVVDIANHQYMSDVTGIVGTPVALTGKTTTGGVFDADNPVFVAVIGAVVVAVILYHDTGTAGTSRLILYNNECIGLPITPFGTDIEVTIDSAGIFTL